LGRIRVQQDLGWSRVGFTWEAFFQMPETTAHPGTRKLRQSWSKGTVHSPLARGHHRPSSSACQLQKFGAKTLPEGSRLVTRSSRLSCSHQRGSLPRTTRINLYPCTSSKRPALRWLGS